MERSKNFNFYLPSRDGDDIADINQISQNFRTIDEQVTKKEYVDEKIGGVKTEIDSVKADSVKPYNWRNRHGNFVVSWPNTSGDGRPAVAETDYTISRLNPSAGDAYTVPTVIEVNALIADGIISSSNVDYSYNPQSNKPQTGLAVAEAMAEVKTIVDAKIDKPQVTPQVGNTLKVASVNEDGTFTCEWVDAQSGGEVDDLVLVEEINIEEEAVVERRYEEHYKKIVVMARNGDSKLPKIRLLGGNYFWEFYGYSADAWDILNVYGEITIPKVFSQAYTLYGNGGENATQVWPIMGRLTQQAEYFNGFKTDSACHVGTTIKVYGVIA